MAERAQVVVTARGAGLLLARPGFRGAVTAAAGEVVEVAGGWYAEEIVAKGLAQWPTVEVAPAPPPSEAPAKPKRGRR